MIEEITVLGKGFIPTIASENNLINGGRMFSAQVANAALGASAVLLIEMIIPDEFDLILKSVIFYNGDDGQYELIEAPTLTTGATPLASYNRNRNSIKASGIVLKSNPTGISGGTNLDNVFFKATNQFPGIPYVANLNWVLKMATTYLLRLTNLGAGAEQALLKTNWAEV